MRGPDFTRWKQVPLDVEHFDYLRDAPVKRAVSAVLTTLVVALLTVMNRAVFGLRIKGRKNLKLLGRRGAVAVCNHVHWLDCSFLARAAWPRRQHFVTLQSNMEVPVIRQILRLARCMPVPREKRQLTRFSHAVDEALRAGAVVHIYPEGWLEPYCTELRTFKNGAFAFARDADVPVLPIRITYRRGRGPWRLKRRPCVMLHILPPIAPDHAAPRGPEIVRLREAARAAMERCDPSGPAEADLALSAKKS